MTIKGKRFSNDSSYFINHCFENNTSFQPVDVLEQDYASCIYDGHWWVVLVEHINVNERDATCNLLHPRGQAHFYYWPETADRAFVPLNKFIKILTTPQSSSNGRKYFLYKTK